MFTTTPLPRRFCVLGETMELGTKWKAYFCPFLTMVCPALAPPLKRALISYSSANIPTSLPFPSSPHCDPNTVQTLDLSPLRHLDTLIKGKIITKIQLYNFQTVKKMNEQQLAQVYEMVDSVPFSRQKKNIARDFSDGLMMAELIGHYYPKRVELHNYPSTNTVTKKIQNWNTLNNKVLKKMGIALGPKQIEDIANVKPMAIEKILYRFLLKFERPQEQAKIPNQNQFENNYGQTERQMDQSFQGTNSKGPGIGLSLPNKKGQMVNVKKEQQDTEQILNLIDKIDYEYARLIKLQELSRMKDDMIKNLEKKVQKIIFN